MSVAVITPFFDKPGAWLQQCLDSVARQTIPCVHFMVCDGDAPAGVEMGRSVEVLRLPRPHQDYGNAARAIGSVSAISQGFEAIAYLDADNWYEVDHLQTLLQAQQATKAAVCTCGRNLFDLEGKLLGPCPEVDGKQFVDTNCFLLTRPAFSLVSVWYMLPRAQAKAGDRVFWRAVLESKLGHTHVPDRTVAFRTIYEAHYRYFGKEPPPGAKRTPRSWCPQVRRNSAMSERGSLRWCRQHRSRPSLCA